jgi:serine/threonine protein kinase
MVHDQGILHCDIKPDNIILSSDSEERRILTLIDFGIATKIGTISRDSQSYYTWWYRNPRLFLDNFMQGFNSLIGTVVEPVEMMPVMDGWAFFITFLHTVSEKSNNFLGLRSKTEDEVRREMIHTSPVARLMKKMKKWLGQNRDISFVREIYFGLLEQKGSENFIETFKKFGIEQTNQEMYDEYLKMFNNLRDKNPIIEHVRNVFRHVRCEDQQIDISEPINKLVDLFIEILRDGSDLSLLGCLTMDHIQKWLNLLNDSLYELAKIRSKVFFY